MSILSVGPDSYEQGYGSALNQAIGSMLRENGIFTAYSSGNLGPKSGSSWGSDSVSFSIEAIAALSKRASGSLQSSGAISQSAGPTAGSASMSTPSAGPGSYEPGYGSALNQAVFSMLRENSSFTVYLSGSPAPASVSSGGSNSVSFSVEVLAALAKGASASPQSNGATSQPAGPTNSFLQVYAQQAADGVVGRFYKETDPSNFTSDMSEDEKNSFMAAYQNGTLNIQTAQEAGVKVGSYSTTFIESGIGGGEFSSGTGTIDATVLMKTAKYAETLMDPFFGVSVVSWGGPPDASAPQDGGSGS